MKKSLSIIMMILIGGLFTFTSCNKDEDVDPGTNPKATIMGTVYANLDATDGDLEYAPQGTEIFFRINSQDLVLNPKAGYTYQTLQFSTTVGADGAYSISLPSVVHQAVNVSIQANQFEAQQTIAAGTYSNVVFVSATVFQGIMADQTYYLDIVY